MKQGQVEFVGKIFVVVGSMRRCLICDGVFSRGKAADHAVFPCYPATNHPKATQAHYTTDQRPAPPANRQSRCKIVVFFESRGEETCK